MLTSRLSDKVWKTRLGAYSELCGVFASGGAVDAETSRADTVESLPKLITSENNVMALEKCLESVVAFAESSTLAELSDGLAGDLSAALVKRALTVQRPNVFASTIKIFQQIVAKGRGEVVQSTLLEAFQVGAPRNVVAAVSTFEQILPSMGKGLNFRATASAIEQLWQNANAGVRAAAQQLAVALARATSAERVVKALSGTLRPAQIESLREALGSSSAAPVHEENEQKVLAPPPPVPKRRRRAPIPTEEVMDVETPEAAPVKPDVPGDAPEVDIDTLLPNGFFASIKSAKWNERRQAIDTFSDQVSRANVTVRGRIDELVGALADLAANDNNVMVAASAVQAVIRLSERTGSRFASYSSILAPAIVVRFGETRGGLRALVSDCLDVMLKRGVALSSIFDVVIDTLRAAKAPKVRASILDWLASALLHSDLDSERARTMRTLAQGLITDASPDIRAAARAVLNAINGKGPAPLAAPKLTVPPKARGPAVVRRQRVGPARPVAAAEVGTRSLPARNRPKRESAAPGPPHTSQATRKPQAPLVEPSSVDSVLDEEVRSKIHAKQWRARLSGVDAAREAVDGGLSPPDALAVVKEISTVLVKESNAQILTSACALLCRACANGALGVEGARAVGAWVVPRLGIPRLHDPASEAIFSAAAGGCAGVALEAVLEAAAAAKSVPKLVGEALKLAADLVVKFGAEVNSKAALDAAREQIEDSNPAVRRGATSLLAALMITVGPAVRDAIGRQRSAILSAVDAEFAALSATEAGKAAAAASRKGPSLDSLLPRAGLLGLIKKGAIRDMASSSWKARLAATESVRSAIVVAENRIEPQLGGLVSALRQLLTDANVNVRRAAIGLVGDLAAAAGPGFEQHVPAFFPSLLAALADSKQQIRAAAAIAMDAVAKAVGFERVALFAAPGVASQKPVQCRETLEWLARGLPEVSALDLGDLAPSLLLRLQDGSVETRHAAEAVGREMVRLGALPALEAALAKLPEAKAAAVRAAVAVIAEQPGEAVSMVEEAGQLVAVASSIAEAVVEIHPEAKQTAQAAAVPPALAAARTPRRRRTPVSVSADPAPRAEVQVFADPAALLRPNKLKSKRIESDRRLRWGGPPISAEDVKQLRDQMHSMVNPSVYDRLFDNDHAAQAVAELTYFVESNPELAENNSDLLIKYVVWRGSENNTGVLLKVLDLGAAVVGALSRLSMSLTEYEGLSLLPMLIDRVGHGVDMVTVRTVSLIKDLSIVFPSSKIFAQVLVGLKSRNSRVRLESAALISFFYKRFGASVTSAARFVPVVARCLTDPDQRVRLACLNFLAEVSFAESITEFLPRSAAEIVAERAERLRDAQPASVPQRDASVKALDRKEELPVEPTVRVTASRVAPRNDDINKELDRIVTVLTFESGFEELIEAHKQLAVILETEQEACIEAADSISNALCDCLRNSFIHGREVDPQFHLYFINTLFEFFHAKALLSQLSAAVVFKLVKDVSCLLVSRLPPDKDSRKKMNVALIKFMSLAPRSHITSALLKLLARTYSALQDISFSEGAVAGHLPDCDMVFVLPDRLSQLRGVVQKSLDKFVRAGPDLELDLGVVFREADATFSKLQLGDDAVMQPGKLFLTSYVERMAAAAGDRARVALAKLPAGSYVRGILERSGAVDTLSRSFAAPVPRISKPAKTAAARASDATVPENAGLGRSRLRETAARLQEEEATAAVPSVHRAPATLAAETPAVTPGRKRTRAAVRELAAPVAAATASEPQEKQEHVPQQERSLSGPATKRPRPAPANEAKVPAATASYFSRAEGHNDGGAEEEPRPLTVEEACNAIDRLRERLRAAKR